MRIRVYEVTSQEDRFAVYALRYAVYVGEMGRSQKHADHSKRIIQEPEDGTARIFAAKTTDGATVGTVRVHLKSAIPAEYAELYNLARFSPFHPAETSTTTKFMVARRFRRSTVALRLAQACYEMGHQAGVSFNFIDCNPHLKSLFHRLGFRQVFPDFRHPEYGLVSPMVLAVRDYDYLEKIGSPLKRPASPRRHESVPYLYDLLAQSAHAHHHQLLDTDDPYRPQEEELEIRRWDGTPWKAS